MEGVFLMVVPIMLISCAASAASAASAAGRYMQ